MSVGFSQNKSDIDSRAGSLTVAVRDGLYRIQVFKSWLDGKTDDDLTALGYTAGDVAVLRSAVSDLADLATVFTGGASAHLTGTYDYRTFAHQLTGVA